MKKGMSLGKRAWCQNKGAWHGAMLKGAGENTIITQPGLYFQEDHGHAEDKP